MSNESVFDDYVSTQQYYKTLFHELAHSAQCYAIKGNNVWNISSKDLALFTGNYSTYNEPSDEYGEFKEYYEQSIESFARTFATECIDKIVWTVE